MNFSKLNLVLAGIVAVSGPALLTAAPAHAALTTAEQTHCYAIGKTYISLSDAISEAAKVLKNNLPANATDKDKKDIADFEETAKTTGDIGNALTRIYASAPAPSKDELDALEKLPMTELMAQTDKCIPK